MSDANGQGEYLTHDEILNADDMRYEDVPVPEWSKNGKAGVVRVRALSAIERDDFEKSIVVNAGKKGSKVDTTNIRAKLCARCIVDKAGNRIFKDDEVLKLGAKSAAAMDRVYEVAGRLSKVSEEDIEELKGNSESGPSDAS
jgi:hypothetical protein